ncbi:unnamed protein product [Notodromas monacha]|uniref:Uncharacterized protein n=1 Tax=Notodromas monacha TaxID=399045 RepID=A0A7R9GBB5_9CRUS|nr:unnamed protein product [Notodromas monacha]CAG0914903.1 unnamed protein product [Notodromas monacha]
MDLCLLFDIRVHWIPCLSARNFRPVLHVPPTVPLHLVGERSCASHLFQLSEFGVQAEDSRERETGHNPPECFPEDLVSRARVSRVPSFCPVSGARAQCASMCSD